MYKIYILHSDAEKLENFPHFLIETKHFSENVLKITNLSLFSLLNSHGNTIMTEKLVLIENVSHI